MKPPFSHGFPYGFPMVFIAINRGLAVNIFVVTGFHRHVGFVGDYYADPGEVPGAPVGEVGEQNTVKS